MNNSLKGYLEYTGVGISTVVITITSYLFVIYAQIDQETSRFIPLLYLIILAIWCLFIIFLVGNLRENKSNKFQVVWIAFISLSFMLTQIFVFALLYRIEGLKSTTGDILTEKDYIYFSAITWTTVGYGDIVPIKDSRFITSFEAIYGYIYMGMFIGILGSFLVSTFDKQKEKKIES